MGTYAVTGSASGMGAATARQLRAAGHRVIGVDLAGADVVADLSRAAGRRAAADGVLALLPDGRLDGAVLAAGVGPAPGRERPRLILEVNHRGVVDLLEAWRPALAAAAARVEPATPAKVVVIASNSASTMPMVPQRSVRALLAGDVDRALRPLRIFGTMAPSFAYGASKVAVARWVRLHATSPAWAGSGIRLNALAPGAVRTPLLDQQLATPAEARRIRSFPIPVGGFGEAEQLAAWVVFMLSDAADFLCGSVVVVDGGSEAWFRATDWPRAVPARRLRSYLTRMRAFPSP